MRIRTKAAKSFNYCAAGTFPEKDRLFCEQKAAAKTSGRKTDIAREFFSEINDTLTCLVANMNSDHKGR